MKKIFFLLLTFTCLKTFAIDTCETYVDDPLSAQWCGGIGVFCTHIISWYDISFSCTYPSVGLNRVSSTPNNPIPVDCSNFGTRIKLNLSQNEVDLILRSPSLKLVCQQ